MKPGDQVLCHGVVAGAGPVLTTIIIILESDYLVLLPDSQELALPPRVRMVQRWRVKPVGERP